MFLQDLDVVSHLGDSGNVENNTSSPPCGNLPVLADEYSTLNGSSPEFPPPPPPIVSDSDDDDDDDDDDGQVQNDGTLLASDPPRPLYALVILLLYYSNYLI